MHILYMLYAICEAYFWATGLTRAKINTKQAKGKKQCHKPKQHAGVCHGREQKQRRNNK